MRFLLPVFLLLLGAVLGGSLKLTDSRKATSRANSSRAKASPALLTTLAEVTGREFAFSTVIARTTGHKILPLTEEDQDLLDHVRKAARQVAETMSQPDSPARTKRRINEVSALFEVALRNQLAAHPDFTCAIPKTKDGQRQRSGYPDLRLEHLPTGRVAYLDPKLFEDRSRRSSFRTFYFEPSPDRTKVTEDALHLLLGFSHDGNPRAWKFAPPEVVDLSTLKVTLKAEFSASNRDLYE